MVDIFLQLPGIPGTSVARGHEDWIELTSATWGVESSSSLGHGGGAGAGKATPHPLIVTAPTSIATPLIFESIVTGRHLPSAMVDFVRPGDDGSLMVVRWEFGEVRLSLIDIAGSEPGLADSFRLESRQVRIIVMGDAPKGGAAQPVSRGWDFAKSQAW